MEKLKIFNHVCFILVINWLMISTSLGMNPSVEVSRFPLQKEDIKNLLRRTFITDFLLYANRINFSYDLMQKSRVRFVNASPELKLELLNSKEGLMNFIKDYSKLKGIYMNEWLLDYTSTSVINELHRLNEGGNLDIPDDECGKYYKEYIDYVDEKTKEILEEMKYAWDNTIRAFGKDKNLGEEQWKLWIERFDYIVSALKKKDFMHHLDYIYMNKSLRGCDSIYEYYKRSFMELYRGPFMVELNKFAIDRLSK